MSSKSKKDEMNLIAMQIILHAGDAKILVEDALNCVKAFNFDSANEKINKAKSEITKAHEAQTNLIQDEAAGYDYPNCLLFNHAQDTLMTTMMFYDSAKQLIDIAEIINKKIDSITKS